MRFVVSTFTVMALALFATPTHAIESGDPGFGKQWVRSHPFMIKGLVSGLEQDPLVSVYWNTNYSFATSNRPTVIQNHVLPFGKSWSVAINYPSWTPAASDLVNSFLGVEGRSNWQLADEARPWDFSTLGTVAANIRALTGGADLIYGNVNGHEATHSTAYPNYLTEYFATIHPDAIQFDTYPFYEDGTTDMDLWFSVMMNIRNRAQGEGIPYFGYMQSFSNAGQQPPNEARRELSESDMRMQAYSMLASGYKGITYFTHGFYPGETGAGLLGEDGTPGPMYPIAQDLNLEIAALGPSLRFLESTDVRFVPGGGTAPDGLSDWTSGSGGVTSIQSIATSGTSAGEDGLIGFFTDDDGENYFMLTNLNHGPGASAASKALNFTVTFDSTVDQLIHLNRETGQEEFVPLNANVLAVTLPGGTGDLFRIKARGKK